MPKIHILGGGTMFYVRPHLALSAPAYGQTARRIAELSWSLSPIPERENPALHLTRMAGGDKTLDTNADVSRLLDEIVADPATRIIFMNVALCDFEGSVLSDDPFEHALVTRSGKDQPRLSTKDRFDANGGRRSGYIMELTPADKLIGKIRKARKDIFLVGFKTTAGASPDEQYLTGLDLLKKASCNLVLANDVHTRLNMVITPEQARYHETTDREEALRGLVEMTLLRSKGTFTRSTIVPGDPVPWDSAMVPESLRTVVNHCIARGAYKPFNGATVGHFAYKLDDKKFVTSRRKVDFNKLPEIGMVLVESAGADNVVAHGFRPSVGGMSQRIIFSEHSDVDCIVHAHIPLKPGSKVPVREQRPYECGSHECGQNTSSGLEDFDGIKAVMLDRHGPNIVFNRNTDPRRVIEFIEENFDLEGRTDNVGASVS